jgi:hypothetical protein
MRANREEQTQEKNKRVQVYLLLFIAGAPHDDWACAAFHLHVARHLHAGM